MLNGSNRTNPNALPANPTSVLMNDHPAPPIGNVKNLFRTNPHAKTTSQARILVNSDDRIQPILSITCHCSSRSPPLKPQIAPNINQQTISCDNAFHNSYRYNRIILKILFLDLLYPIKLKTKPNDFPIRFFLLIKSYLNLRTIVNIPMLTKHLTRLFQSEIPSLID